MKTLCTARRYQGISALALFWSALLVLSIAGCSRPPKASMEEGCPPLDLLETIQRDPEIEHYATGLFNEPRLLVLWDDMPEKLEECSNEGDQIRFIRSSTPSADRRPPFILIEKMYFDTDAAFVQAYLYPSGKNIDAFMRKKSGRWQVVESSLWEN